MTHEPAVTVGTITALVAALITLLTAFGVDITGEQREAILGFVAIVGPIVAGVIIRGRVTPAGD